MDFISFKDQSGNIKLINARYIKEITKNHIIVANTQQVSISTGYLWCKDENIYIDRETYESIIDQLDKTLKELELENSQLRMHIQLMPGGTEYLEAKTHFETHKQQIKK